MGSSNTKPSDVSDAAWERQQEKKLEMVKEEIRQRDQFKQEAHHQVTNLVLDYDHYCRACHDVPKVLMLLPSYRNQCSEARGKLINNTMGYVLNTDLVVTREQMIEKINNM